MYLPSLDSNRIRDVGAIALQDSLEQNRTLKVLRYAMIELEEYEINSCYSLGHNERITDKTKQRLREDARIKL